jgi:predicted GNAT family N-acyltransferase
MMTVRTIDYNSPQYEQLLQLRIRSLLLAYNIPADFIKRETESNDFHIGAFEGDQLLGCCVLTPRGSDLVQLRQMIVDPSLQKKGVGAAIVAFAEELAQAHGFTTVMMHARNAAIGFYEKLGYVIVGDEFMEVNIPHHRMEKRLVS